METPHKLGLFALLAVALLTAGFLVLRSARAAGGRLVFVDGPSREVRVAQASGGSASPYCAEPGHRDTPFAMSPDGSQLAYVTSESMKRTLHIASGVDCRDDRIVGTYGGFSEKLAWSADGSRLLFGVFQVRSAPNPRATHRESSGGDWDVFVAGSVGDPTNLTDDPSDDSGASWSPDGGRIALVSMRDGLGDLYVVTASTGAMTRITTGGRIYPSGTSWSPDGRSIAAVRGAPSAMLADAELVTIAVDTGDVKPIVRGEAVAKKTALEHPRMSAPTWSPSGTHIALEVNQTQSNVSMRYDSARVVLVSLEGDIRSLVDGQSRCPTFSPDGKKVAFVVTRSHPRDEAIAIAKLEGGEAEVAVADAGCPVWLAAR